MIPVGTVLEEDLQTTGLHVLELVAMAHKQTIVEPHNLAVLSVVLGGARVAQQHLTK
jgi:hypothetical protein